MSYATRLLAALLAEQDAQAYLSFGNMAPIFELDPIGKEQFAFVSDYVSKTGNLPPIEVVEEEIDTTIKVEDADPKWLHGKAVELHVERSLKLAAQGLKDAVSEDPMEALNIMLADLQMIKAHIQAPKVVDFKNSASVLWPYLVDKWNNIDSMVKFGWPYLDNQTGGLRPGDMVSLVGRPGEGKTWFLLWVALNIWQQLKKPVLFVSMEMDRYAIMERAAAIFTQTEADFFKFGMGANLFGQNVKKTVKKQLALLEASDMPPFIVVDGDLTATVEDVVSLSMLHQVAATAVDGGYMLEAPGAKGMYDAAAISARGLKKQLASGLGVPTLVTYQFENLKNLKKGQKPTLDNIGYTRQIGELSSIALGLLQGDQKDNVKLLNRRVVDVLKGRQGQTGEFEVNWDFHKMDFSEIDKTKTVKIYN